MTNIFSGKRTYIAAVLMVILSGMKAQGYLDEQTFQVGYDILLALGLVALRVGVNNIKVKK